jgi:hypothetical protein
MAGKMSRPTVRIRKMDPNAALREILELTNREVKETLTVEETQRLRELVDALHSWIVRGGFLPTLWNAYHPPI